MPPKKPRPLGPTPQGDWKRLVRHYGEKAVKVGSDLAEIVVHLPAKPGPLGLVVAGSRVLNTLREIKDEKRPETFFGKEWEHMRNVGSFSNFLLSLSLSGGFAKEEQEASSENGQVVTAEIRGFRYGWIKYESWTAGPWMPKGTDETDALHNLGRLVWELLGSNLKVINKPLAGTVIVQDTVKDTLASANAERLFERLDLFNKAGFTRSALLIGEPGTGKSNIMRYVCKLSGGLSLRFPAREIGEMTDVTTPLLMLCPDAVLIDDLDRTENPEAILTQVEDIRDSTKIFIVSVNDVSGLDPAVLRTGRFDEYVEVDQLDESIRRALIGDDLSDAIVEALMQLPIAAIDDFKKRRIVLGVEQAIEEVADLVARTDMIRALAYGDEDEKTKKKGPPPWHPQGADQPTEG